MRVIRLSIGIFLFLLLAASVFAQKNAEQEKVRRAVLYFEIDPAAELTQEQQTLLYESLLAEISDASRKVAIMENREDGTPAGDQEKTAYAENIGADSWLHVLVGGDFELLILQVRCLDLLNGIIAFEFDLEKGLLRGTRELGLLFWSEVEEAVTAYFESALNIDTVLGELTFQAIPGTRIRGVGRKRLKITDNSIASAQVPLPSTIPYRATKPGYWPIESQVYMDQPEKTVFIDQTPGSRAALDFYLNNFNFPGFDFTVFLVPDMVFAKTGILTYLLGFVLEDGDREESEFFVSFTLNHYNLSMGFFLNAPDRYFRPYVSAGVFWRIITAKGYWGVEPIAPFGMQPILGFEYSRQPRHKFYFEYAPIVHWTGSLDNTVLLLISVPSDNDFSGYLPLEWCVINLFNVKMGFRLRL